MYLRKIKNIIFWCLVVGFTLSTFVPLFLILKHTITMGWSELSLDFIFNTPRAVGELGGGMSHAIVGSLMIIFVATIISVPVGIVTGTFLSEFSNSRLASITRTFIGILAGTPSIVIGIFAYVTLVVPWKSFSGWAGSLALSLVILPIVTRSTEEVLKLVPTTIREAGLALGFTKVKIFYYLLIKGNKRAILTGVILAISRSMGETAPLLFTAFGNVYLSYNLNGPISSLPVQIFNYASSPHLEWQRQAWTGAVVLIIIIFAVNIVSKIFVSNSSNASNR
ncbi:MAG: phosphate ABC transporter permease PstA [Oligoflexia bacterium]|nr:phosphate ABC transporter permease PstA [Oligoflexia bacterium]